MVYIAFLCSLVIVALDQLTKWLAVVNIQPFKEGIPLIKFGDTEVLYFTYCENTGMSFSLLEGQQTLLIIITSVFIAGLTFYLLTKRCKTKLMMWSVVMIIGGGIGNLIDRVLNGYVVDFIDFRLINFAVFNVADIFAVCGAILLLLALLLDEFKDRKKKTEDAVQAEKPEETDGEENGTS